MDVTLINKIVINLPERKERLESFKHQFQYIGGEYQIQNGVRGIPSWKGIALAHLKAIQTAKNNGWDKVLIMEDDVIFQGKEKTLPYINEAMKKLPEDWDMVLGGVYYLRAEDKVNNYWRRIGEFCSLHWYIVNERIYDRIMQWDGNNHIDRWMGTQGFKIYLPRRMWAIQSNGYSDNVERDVDYSNLLVNFEVLR